MRKVIVLAALALLAASGGRATSAPAAIDGNGTAGAVRPFSVQYMNGAGTVSLTQALDDARAFDVIVALPKVYSGSVAAMKQANPKLKLFVYAKGPFTRDTSLPEGAYSHDASGNRIQGVQYPTWLLDPTSPDAISAQVAAARSLLTKSGYDGVFLDTLGPAALNLGFVEALPVNPTTGLTWTASDWMTATANFAGQIATDLGRPTIGNGLRDGKNYFTSGTNQLLQTSMVGAMAEAWLRGATNSITSYPKEAIWKQNVDAVVDAGAHDKSFLAVTKVWTTGTQAQKDAWYKYTVASFLLANDGKAYLSFSYDNGDATVAYKWGRLNLGAPTGPYAKVSGVYQRSFSAGRVLVNPTTSTFTVPLGGTYKKPSGTLATSVTLGPNTAEILTTP